MTVKNNSKLLKRILIHKELYLMLIIPIIYIIIFQYIPMLGVQIAFRDYNARDGIWGSPWRGMYYFEKFFNSYQFNRVIKNTLTLSIYGLFASIPVAIILALFLNVMRSKKYRKFIQTVTYMPHFISTVVLVGMLMQILNPRTGLVSHLYRLFAWENTMGIMSNPKAFPHVYVWSGVWKNMGWNSIIYFAALSSSDPELHEAMEIDGANRFKRLLYIDIPCIIPTATVLFILNAGRIMNVGFEKVLIMQNNINISVSEVISTYVYKVGIAGITSNFSYGAAIGLFNSTINFMLLLMVNAIAKKVGTTSLF